MGIAYGIFGGKALPVGLFLLRGGSGRNGVLGRRHYVDIGAETLPDVMLKAYCHALGTCFCKSELPVFLRPYQQVSQTGVEGCSAVGSRGVSGNGIELGVIVNLEFYLRTLDGRSAVEHGHNGAPCRYVASDYIDFGIAWGAPDNILGSVVIAVHLGVQEHGP